MVGWWFDGLMVWWFGGLVVWWLGCVLMRAMEIETKTSISAVQKIAAGRKKEKENDQEE